MTNKIKLRKVYIFHVTCILKKKKALVINYGKNEVLCETTFVILNIIHRLNSTFRYILKNSIYHFNCKAVVNIFLWKYGTVFLLIKK